MAAAGAALLAPMLFLPPGHPFVTTLGLTMLYLGYGMILLSLVSKRRKRGRESLTGGDDDDQMIRVPFCSTSPFARL